MKLKFKGISSPRLTFRRVLLMLAGLVFLVIVGLYLAATAFPAFGAQGSDALRSVIGDQAVAQLETWIFQVQDSIHQTEYKLGLNKPESPWQDPNASLPVQAQISTETPAPTLTLTLVPSATPLPTLRIPLGGTATPEPTATPTATIKPSPTPWRPAPAHALGSLEGEGAWQAYIKDVKGNTVAYRTFIQPDPKRPYALVAAVAFDLTHTRLHFVLGVDEPKSTAYPKRSGKIPAADEVAGVLLATFNGGFKSEHGNYGAMADGMVAIQPTKDLATVAMYKDGSVRIGAWGTDILPSDNILAWRQNCRLVVQNGQINPLVNVDSYVYWGANLNGATTTWRSGIGVSADGKTLYYIAGPSMKADILAQAMLAVGVQNGMQLDINNYWVHFAAIRASGAKLVAEPLYPEDMKFSVDRYLTAYARDFFYVTLVQ